MNGFWERLAFALRCFFSILLHADIPLDILQKLVKPAGAAPQAATAAAPSVSRPVSRLKEGEPPSSEAFDRAIQMLALLQRDGRLVDFLAEDISAYPDAQIGAAVRTIHDNCRQVLDKYVKLEPILNSDEDQPVTVPAGFDLAAIRLIGKVAGEPPVRGVLRHKGWRVKELNLPPLPQGAGRMVVAPAEVELS
ncbi:MAG TPA: DUF2760 domain-containing protein [Candidatus Polarisedimenticolia bacterium]|nr:DUF2760 domain-containing protein [Candidatus Polarisedimenticolia bacterium]